MALKDKEEISRLIAQQLEEKLTALRDQNDISGLIVPSRVSLEERSISLVERIVRVEEETKNLRKDMKEGFVRMDKRFQDMQIQMDKRFQDMQIQMDKRFQDMQTQMDKRFEQVDKRFTSLQWFIGLGFVFLSTLISVLNFFLR